ncbi:MAG: sensor domain-containing diguanylate cyclase [Candidatus Auribacterota bacterium]
MALSHSDNTPLSVSFLMPVLFFTGFLSALCCTFCAYYLSLDFFVLCGIAVIHIMISVSWLFFDPVLSWLCIFTGCIYLLLFPGVHPQAGISLFASGCILQLHFYRYEKRLSRQELFASEQKTQIDTLLASRSSAALKLMRTKENMDRLSHIKALSEALCGMLDVQSITDSVCETVNNTIKKADIIRIYLLKEDMQTLVLHTQYTTRGSAPKEPGEKLTGYVLRHNKPVLIQNTVQDKRAKGISPKIKSILCVPLRSGTSLSGILRVDTINSHPFQLADLRFLSNIAHVTGLAVQNAGLYQDARRLSVTDGLTGLYTHSYLKNKLRDITEQNIPFCLIFLDLDNFKTINDTFGHPIGDQALITVSRILTSVLTTNDCAARYGGEEFALILHACTPKEGLCKAEQIRGYIENTSMYVRRRKVVLTVSVGIAFYPETSKDANTLLSAADRALYTAKSSGKNKVVQA